MKDDEDTFANQIQIQIYTHQLWKAISDSEKIIPTYVESNLHNFNN